MQQREVANFLAQEGGVTVIKWDKAAIERCHSKLLAAALTIWNLDKILQDPHSN